MSGEGDLKLTEKFEKATVVLIDIAGTSSSICFVKDTLFPYVLNKSESYLTDKWENTDVQELVKVLRENDPEILKEGDKDAIIKSIGVSIKSLSEKNSDLDCFKKFQGLIYIEGYGSGDLKGHVYPDVATQLPVWANGKKVCVYSTGSVDSQKLLFTHSSEGNLTEHITEYFDMAAGVKTEAASYKKIAEKLQCKPEEIVFLTDSVAEAKAAVEAGVNPVLVSREGNEEISEDDKKQFPVITSFTELSMESSGKRKITEEAEQEAPPAKVAKKELETKEEKPVEKAPPAPAEAEEKMEVDAPEVVTETKADEPMEKCNDTETVSSTSETTEEPKEKKESEAAEPAAETKEAESKEEKPAEKEKEKDVPSTDKAEEKSSVEEKKTETKTEEMEAVVSESKPEESGKQTEKVESTETKKSDKKETEKETVVETTKETVDSTDKNETEEIKDKVDSSNDTKEEPKLETNEATEKEDKKDKECEEKHETEETKEPENAKTDSEVAKVEEKTVEPEETKKVEKEKEEAKPETNESASDTKKESTPDTKESAPDTKESAPETNDATPEKKESNETTVDGAVKETIASEKAEEKAAEKEETPAKEADDDKSKNGDAKENGNTNNKSEGKENKSELANGAHIENGDEKKSPEEESEIKVKKIETENSEKTEAAVSVEVKA